MNQRLEALKNQHEIVASHCARDGKKAAKTEGRVVKFTAGCVLFGTGLL